MKNIILLSIFIALQHFSVANAAEDQQLQLNGFYCANPSSKGGGQGLLILHLYKDGTVKWGNWPGDECANLNENPNDLNLLDTGTYYPSSPIITPSDRNTIGFMLNDLMCGEGKIDENGDRLLLHSIQCPGTQELSSDRILVFTLLPPQ